MHSIQSELAIGSRVRVVRSMFFTDRTGVIVSEGYDPWSWKVRLEEGPEADEVEVIMKAQHHQLEAIREV